MRQYLDRPFYAVLSAAVGIGASIACVSAGAQTPGVAAGSGPVAGIDRQLMDPSVRPQDDFYAYINGKWLATVEIPADKGILTPFNMLGDATEEELKALIEGIFSTSRGSMRSGCNRSPKSWRESGRSAAGSSSRVSSRVSTAAASARPTA